MLERMRTWPAERRADVVRAARGAFACIPTSSAGRCHEAPARGPRQLRFARRRRPPPRREAWRQSCATAATGLYARRSRARAPAKRTASCSASFGGLSGRLGSAPNGRRAARSSDFSTTLLRARDRPVGNIEPHRGADAIRRKCAPPRLSTRHADRPRVGRAGTQPLLQL